MLTWTRIKHVPPNCSAKLYPTSELSGVPVNSLICPQAYPGFYNEGGSRGLIKEFTKRELSQRSGEWDECLQKLKKMLN